MVKKEDLSLIIPTYNRPRYLQRLLSYYNNQNINYEILIPDSSTNSIKEINKRIISSFSHLKINHIDHFSSETNYYHKLANTVDFLKMKYSVLCADDDYIAPKALDRCIAFLEKNPDFTAVGGYYISFLVKQNKQGQKDFFWKRYLSTFPHIKSCMSQTSSNPKTRLITHFSFYVPTLYYVHKTDFMQMIYKETLPLVKDLDFAASFGELLQDMLTIIYGKIKTLNILYGARESIPVAKGTPLKYAGVIKPLMNGSFDIHYTRFRNCLIKHLSQVARIDLQTSKKAVDEGMNLFIQRYIGKYPFNPPIKKLIRSLRQAIYYSLINLTQYHFFSFRKQINLRHWNWNNPPSKYYEDFLRIRKNVLDSVYGEF